VILLDTSVLSRAFRRSRPGAEARRARSTLERLLAGDAALGLPGTVLQEVLSGIRSQKQFAQLERLLLSSFTIVHPTTADNVAAAALRNACLAKGVNVSGPDCLIAALAIAGDHHLVAADDDFRAIARHSTLKCLTFEELD